MSQACLLFSCFVLKVAFLSGCMGGVAIYILMSKPSVTGVCSPSHLCAGGTEGWAAVGDVGLISAVLGVTET